MLTRSIKLLITILLFTFIWTPLQVIYAELSEGDKLNNVRSLIDWQYVDSVPNEILQRDSIDAILRGLDPYSQYMSRAEYERFVHSLDPSLSGIGVQVEKVERGVLIINVFADGPAYQSGLQSRDMIVGVNGQNIADVSLEVAISMITGESGTSVRLKIYRPSTNETFEITVVRQPINVPLVTYDVLGGNIGYIRLNSFGEQTINQLKNALQELEGVDGYIFDLRNNGGGYFNAAREVLGLFNGIDVAVNMNSRQIPHVQYSVIQQIVKFNNPVSLLVNSNSASASEIVAGAVKDYQAATLYGQNTFGKGSMQSFFYVDGSNPNTSDLLKLTIARFTSPLGNPIDGVGVSPDVVTSEGQEIMRSHGDFLIRIYEAYRKLFLLDEVEEDDSFLVEFTSPVDWTTITPSSFELIE